MDSVELRKPDGRSLTLYARDRVADVGPLLGDGAPFSANPHLRWHPLLGTWVAYAAHRQNRTFLPPPEYNPLMPSSDPERPTELPTGCYDVAVFDNRFPTLSPAAHDAPSLATVQTAPGAGQCEVVVYSQDPHRSLGHLPLDHVALLLEVWADRTRKLGARAGIEYVLPFENRGVEVGVTLHHPHGQIYGYPFVPSVPARIRASELDHYARHGSSLLQSGIEREIEVARRIVYCGSHAVAFVPAWARYTYEVWVAPRQSVARLDGLSADQVRDLARALKTVLLKYDGLWSRPFPYILHWYQAPTDGAPHPEVHLHAEFYPAYRAPGKLKYLAGTEIAAGLFANDALPEEKARELIDVAIDLDG
ncbi:MAG TPA: galactose-1-phosphate uridylyltransferase [Steroidobacteraceae bacterium]|nr:galactose-1-phosphate uridylyltransferase [Steroidobacteraceae bacterium]